MRLQGIYCPLEQGAMLQAALVIVQFYHELAPPWRDRTD